MSPANWDHPQRQYASLRILLICGMVILFGLFSAMMTWFVSNESHLFQALFQDNPHEWQQVELSTQLPVAIAMILIPILTSLTVGVHFCWHGGLVSFAISLFNLLPFYLMQTVYENGIGLLDIRLTPLVLACFGCGALVAFYVGDLASWLCRKRIEEEAYTENLATVTGN